MVDLTEPLPLPVDAARATQLRDAIEAMYFGYRAFTDRADRILAEHGLGRLHHRILYFVGRNPGVSIKGLLDILAVSKQAINAPVRELVDQGLIAMIADVADRRMKNLSLTAAGCGLESALTGAQMACLDQAFANVDADGETDWKTVMRAMARGEA